MKTTINNVVVCLQRILVPVLTLFLIAETRGEVKMYRFTGVFQSFGESGSHPFTGFIEVDTSASPSHFSSSRSGERGWWYFYERPNFRIRIETETGIVHDSSEKAFVEQYAEFFSFDTNRHRMDGMRDYQRGMATAVNMPGGEQTLDFRMTNERGWGRGEWFPLSDGLRVGAPDPWRMEDYSSISISMSKRVDDEEEEEFGDGYSGYNLVCDRLDSWEPMFSDSKDLLQETRDVLEGLDLGEDKLNKEASKVVKHLDKALEDELWMDGNRLSKEGVKVFKALAKAVHYAEKLVKKVPEQASYFEEVRVFILGISRDLAQEAIDEAREGGGDVKKLEHADKKMAKAEKELGKAHLEHAIEHFGKAWKEVTKSLNK